MTARVTARFIVYLSAVLLAALVALPMAAQQRPAPPVLLNGVVDPGPEPDPDPEPIPDPNPPRTGSVPRFPPTSGVPYNLGSRSSDTFDVRWPAAPNVTREVTVRTQSEFNTALRANGTRSVLASGRTFTGGLLTCSDCELVGYGAQINGDMRFGGRRFRAIGLNVRGACDWRPGTPAPVDGLFWNTNCTAPNGGTSSFQMSADGWRRIALVYSTFRVMTPAGTNGWAFFVQNGGSGPPYVGEELIIAGSLIRSAGQVSRFQDVRGVIIRDSMFYADNLDRPALRIRYASRDFDVRDTHFVGSTTGQEATVPLIDGDFRRAHWWWNGQASSLGGPNGICYNAQSTSVNDNVIHCTNDGGRCNGGNNTYGRETNLGTCSGSRNIVGDWQGWPNRPSLSGYGADH